MNQVPYLEFCGISKEFPGVKALQNVSFACQQGTVHALMGENGAGKSTLLKILSGFQAPTRGVVKLAGQEKVFQNTVDALESGIAIIYQELHLIPEMTVAENIYLGQLPHKGGVVNRSLLNYEAGLQLKHLGLDVDPQTPLKYLSIGQWQMVEIAKALSIDARILIMDEPTSSLTAKEIDDLFRIIRKLRDEGRGIVYISHRLEELSHIVDRVTIMRDGQYITDGNFKDMDMDYIIKNMVGREIKEKFPRVECRKGKKIFEVKNLNAGKMVRDINFSLYEGEIVGFAGLMGAGRTETTRAIFGVDPKDSGEFYVDGKKIEVNCPMDAIRNGVVLAPEDRKKDGLCTKLSIRQNLALPNLDLVCNKMGVINSGKEDALCEKAVKDLRIKTPNVEIDSGNLSGGNQQKVVLAKWLVRNIKLLILDEPTNGLDPIGIAEVRAFIRSLSEKEGKTILVSSHILSEISMLADDIGILDHGVLLEEETMEELKKKNQK